ncbi:MFS transporter [Acidisphaera sp. L21]|uniref:MFS transporter n=1 Tax=Acidisphaera sp. L21 TaxID=1641851 RepID=UPI00131B2EC7|nr:MFS transporter [Acidisphaera sp. L21]
MQQKQATPKFRRKQWLAVGLCTMAIILNYIDRSTLAISTLSIRQEFGISATAIGLLNSTFAITFALSQLPVGLVVDRVGPRRLMGASIVLWSLTIAAGGLVTSFTHLLWSRAGLALFESPAFAATTRTVSNWFNIRDRGRPTGVYTLGADLGRIIGTPVLTLLLVTFNWRTMFVVMGVLGLVIAVVWFVLYRDPEASSLDKEDLDYLGVTSVAPQAPVTFAHWRRLFAFRSTWGMILGAFFSGYAIWLYGAWLPSYLEMQHHVSIAKTGVLAMIPLACSIAGSLAGGWFTDWLAHGGIAIIRSRKIPAGIGYPGAALFCVLAACTTDLTLALGSISASLFFLSFGQSGKWTLVTAVAPDSYAASLSSIQNFGAFAGGTISPIVTGMVVDATGSFVLALVIGSVIMLAAAVCYTGVVAGPISLSAIETRYPLPNPAMGPA